MDSDEAENEKIRTNVVPHPQTIRRWNRSLDSALIEGNIVCAMYIH